MKALAQQVDDQNEGYAHRLLKLLDSVSDTTHPHRSKGRMRYRTETTSASSSSSSSTSSSSSSSSSPPSTKYDWVVSVLDFKIPKMMVCLHARSFALPLPCPPSFHYVLCAHLWWKYAAEHALRAPFLYSVAYMNLRGMRAYACVYIYIVHAPVCTCWHFPTHAHIHQSS